jgi:hypothetical protein
LLTSMTSTENPSSTPGLIRPVRRRYGSFHGNDVLGRELNRANE